MCEDTHRSLFLPALPKILRSTSVLLRKVYGCIADCGRRQRGERALRGGAAKRALARRMEGKIQRCIRPGGALAGVAPWALIRETASVRMSCVWAGACAAWYDIHAPLCFVLKSLI